jgi:SpoVK/Ycf46/Vps4 family AAA+-type ATPase
MSEKRRRAQLREVVRKAAGGDQPVTVALLGRHSTGKAKAAEALAGELDRRMFRIDLTEVVSKYIDETEKNLGRVFDEAESEDWVLFFDEADALFDRDSQVGISYLIERSRARRGTSLVAAREIPSELLGLFDYVIDFD